LLKPETVIKGATAPGGVEHDNKVNSAAELIRVKKPSAGAGLLIVKSTKKKKKKTKKKNNTNTQKQKNNQKIFNAGVPSAVLRRTQWFHSED